MIMEDHNYFSNVPKPKMIKNHYASTQTRNFCFPSEYITGIRKLNGYTEFRIILYFLFLVPVSLFSSDMHIAHGSYTVYLYNTYTILLIIYIRYIIDINSIRSDVYQFRRRSLSR